MFVRRAPWFGRAAGGVAAAAVLLTASALASSGTAEHVAREGGTFRVAVAAGRFNTIDPALIVTELQLLDPTCGNLMAYPSKPLPEGGRLRPELAEAKPDVSRDGRTYTFRIRGGETTIGHGLTQ